MGHINRSNDAMPATSLARLTISVLSVAALVLVGLDFGGPLASARADTAPTVPGTPTTVAADSLPTVQINGVAWSQTIVGGTVYVAGDFATARPAGAAAGTSTVPRADLLAYDLATGTLINSWAPKLNGPAYVIEPSLDGTRLYVGGNFTTVNGAAQNRFVVLDRSTGQRVPAFATGANAAVRAIASTPSTIYLGGNFTVVAGNTRNRLAAVSATTGALLSWKVSAQSAQVDSMVLSPDDSRLIVGGRFTMLGGIPAAGSGAVSTVTGAVLPWAANAVIQDDGYSAGIESLVTDGNLIYGSGFAFLGHDNSIGNLEGVFAADPNTGAIVWIEDCHGDTYSVFANPGGANIYSVGHTHYCGNIGMYPEGAYRYSLSWSKQAVMTITPNVVPNYFDWEGYRAPAQLDYYPDFTAGSYTGQGQATWEVTGNSQYVLYGGEFPTVNGQGQQGLARMAVSSLSTNSRPLKLSGGALTPAATSEATGTAQVSWPSNWDQDNETLTYQVLRDSSTTPIYSTTGQSRSWQLPRLSFTDTGLANGSTHSYRVVATDAFGNSTTSPSVSVTVAGSSAGPLSAYAKTILLDSPSAYFRLGESGGAAQDWTGFADDTVGSGVTRAVAGALSGDPNAAARFTGTNSSRVYSTRSSAGPNRFSVEAWFTTTSTTGGKIVGFGTSSSTSNSSSYDRQVYLSPDGHLYFGVNPNSIRTVTAPLAYNDGRWHQVVATLSFDGMKLYVDGHLTAQDPNTVSAQQLTTGYWRIGGDAVSGWPGAGADNFSGDLDDVAVYGSALTAAQVAAHYASGTGGTVPVNQPPVARFTATPTDLTVAVDGSASTDPDGTITGYAWDFGDGSTATGPTTSHTYPAAGTYPITLTVTDNSGATTPVTRSVTVSTSAAVVASDAFGRTVADGFGTADLGGAWATTAVATSVSGGSGRLSLGAAGAVSVARLPGVTGTDLLTQVTESWDKRPSGSGGWFLLRGRITTAGEYRLKLGHTASGAVTAHLMRTDASGTEAAVTAQITVPGLTYSPGTAIVAQLDVSGTAPTRLRAKVWAATGTQPTNWLIDTTDATTALQVSGYTGLAALISTSATNVPVTVQVDDYSVTSPAGP